MNGKLENEYRINSIIEKKLQLCPDFIADWENWLQATGLTASTRLEYLTKIIGFLKYINDDTKKIKLTNLSDKIFVGYFISIRTTNKNGNIEETSDGYRQGIYYVLKNFCDYLEKYHLSKYNYMNNIQKPKTRAKINVKKEFLTESDFRKILKSAEKEIDPVLRARDICILKIFMTTGMRKTALQSINIEDIDFDNNSLIVIDKEEATQNYPLSNTTISSIEKWIKMRDFYVDNSNPTNALFLSYQGNRMCSNSVAKVVRKYCKLALGYEMSPHKLRAGYCSILYDQKGDIEFVRRAVGHARVTTTQRYIRTDDSERNEAANIFDNIL